MKKYISLNGQWDFVADLDPKYHNDRRIYASPAYTGPDIERRHWIKVPVPGVWQKYRERYDIYEGVCWFSRNFNINGFLKGSKARLRFGAVNYLCRIFLNGNEIGGHETGYTEFVLDVSNDLVDGINHIAVMVDNRASVTKWPPCLGYFNYGGIHRDVTLEILDGCCLDSVVLSSCTDGCNGILQVKGNISCLKDMPETPEHYRIRLSCGDFMTLTDVDGKGTFDVCLNVPDIKPWSPEEPFLYNVSLSLLYNGKQMDCEEFIYGFKTMGMQNGKIFLNGKVLALKGICYVYDSPINGLVMTDEQILHDIKLMKELGCNAVRCHYPMNGNFYAACDREGLLVWIEPMIYCYHPADDETDTAFSDVEWIRLARQMISEMIRTARNHPSVSIYGIGNECNTANPEAEEFFKGLAGLIRSEDSSRLISYAALYGIVGPLTDIVDVLGINSYWGWYDKIFGGKGLKPVDGVWQTESESFLEPIDLAQMRQMIDNIVSEGHKELTLLLTEFGADSVPGYYSKSRDMWSENYHADLLGEIFKLAADYPQIVGTFPFCFSDYRDPSKVPNGYWNEINLKGVVTYDRKKKLAFDTLVRYYN